MIALMIGLATVPVLFLKEPLPATPLKQGLLGSCFRRNGFLVWLFVIGFYKFGDAIASGMLRPFLVDQGLGLDELGRIVGTIGFVAGCWVHSSVDYW